MRHYFHIQTILLPLVAVTATYDHLRQAGRRGVEGVVLWAGGSSGDTFQVREAIIPEQTALRLEQGLCYIVDEVELHRINVWLFERKLRLIAQIHSHPADAYHSDTDDLYPIMTKLGSLSVVVPNFAAGSIDPATWVVFRLTAQHGWSPIPPDEVQRLLVIER